MATKNAPHIPTLPFGTKGVVVNPLPAMADDARGERELGPFRFVMTQEQIAATLLSPRKNPGPAVAPADRLEKSPRSLLLLCVVAAATLAVTLLIWSETSNGPEEVAVRRGPAPAHRRVPQSSPQKAVLAQAMIPAALPERSPPQISAPLRAPSATPHAEALTRTRLSAPKARPTLKRQSVLASVLAPPPAD